jgi:hypothetical protein
LPPDRAQTVLHSSPVASSDNTAFSHRLRFMHTIGAVYKRTLDCIQRVRDWSHWNAPWRTALSYVHGSYMLLVRTKQALWIK